MNIKIIDTTICNNAAMLSFKDKLDIARVLDKLNVDTILLPEIKDENADILLAKTIGSFLVSASLSVKASLNTDEILLASKALSTAKKQSVVIELPVSSVLMEYSYHLKEDAMLKHIKEMVSFAKAQNLTVEFAAKDATRADTEFLVKALTTAKEAGASSFTVCDDDVSMNAEDYKKFINNISEKSGLKLNIAINNKLSIGIGNALLAVTENVFGVRTNIIGEDISFENFVDAIVKIGNNYSVSTNVISTSLHESFKGLKCIKNGETTGNSALENIGVSLDENSTKEDVKNADNKLGFRVAAEEMDAIYNDVLNFASKKKVGASELDAIVENVVSAVPETYKLVSYIVNCGNTISSSAQITILKNGVTLQGISVGDGPIDASFLAIDSLLNNHYELADFQIEALTEGKEALGSANVKLLSGEKIYSGNGISTDIIEASVKAYINALNKIAFMEA